jgi:1-acyl-sn-glycerol-3-phosphate acyltransferase
MLDAACAKRVTYDLSRLAARLVGVALFQIRCQGRRNFPRCDGALVCSNHQSYLDPVLVGLACDRRLNYLARQTLFDFRLLGGLIRWYDAIPIQRDGLGLSGLKETLRRLRRGELVLVFPEGRRSNDGQVARLKPGFCALARRAKVPLISVGIDGAFDAWPRDRRWPRLVPIGIHVGPPLWPSDFLSLSDAELVSLVEQRIRGCHQAARRMRQSANLAPCI